MANKKKSKLFSISQKIIPRLAATLYVAIYSTHYYNVQMMKPWLRLDNETLKLVAIFIAYILASSLETIDIKYHKTVKLIYLLNALLFILIMCI